MSTSIRKTWPGPLHRAVARVMGAQTSAGATPIDGLALRQDSRGQKIIPYASAKEIEALGLARIAELESELEQTANRLEQKEEELNKTQRLLCKLEGAVEQQAKDAELEQHRISQLEGNLAQQQTGTEEKVAKLLLAVAGEKQRTELAEKACEDVVEKHASELKALKEQLKAEEDRRKGEEERRLLAELQVKAMENEIKSLQQKLNDATGQPISDTESSQIVHELQNQVADEVAKRMDVQNRLLQKDKRLREVQEELAKVTVTNDGMTEEETGMLVQARSSLALEESKRMEMEGKLMEKDMQLQDLQQKLADELQSRMAAQQQVAERDRQLSHMQLAVEGDDLCQKQAMQTQVIEKTRVACELQQQLADELGKRQEVQYQLLQKERQVCEMQQQILSMERVSSMVVSQSRVVDGRTVLSPSVMLELPPHDERDEREQEPDDEKSPRSSNQSSDSNTRRDDLEIKRSCTSGTLSTPGTTPAMQLTPGAGGSFTAAPPGSARVPGSWGIFSWMPVSSTMPSPAPVYRNHSGTPATMMEQFVRTYNPATQHGENAVPLGQRSSTTNGGAAMRNRMYLSQNSPGGPYPAPPPSGTKSTSDTRRTSPCQNQNRRLVLASRTFT